MLIKLLICMNFFFVFYEKYRDFFFYDFLNVFPFKTVIKGFDFKNSSDLNIIYFFQVNTD